MNLVITGGLGHIGSYFLRHLSDDLDLERILVVDSLVTQRYTSLFDLPQIPKISFIEKNARLLTKADIAEFGNVDCLIHLSATTDASGTANQRDQLFENNFGTTKAITELCVELGIPMIFPSSTSVYGSQEKLVDETCQELLPQSPYAESKLLEEQTVQEASARGLHGVVLRFGTIHGISPGMRFHTAVNRFCYQSANNLPLTVWKTALHQYRPYLSLADANRAVAHVIRNGLFEGEIYNVVTANHTVHEIIQAIEVELGRPCKVDFVESQIMNQLSYEISSEKFSSTGFIFTGKLEKDISQTLQLLSGIKNE